MAKETDRLEAVISVVDESSKNIEKITQSYDKMSKEMLRVKANMDNVKRSSNQKMQVQLETKKARENAKALERNMNDLKSGASQLGGHVKTLGLAFGTTLVAGFTMAIKSGMELEKQLISIQHFVGVNNKKLSKDEVQNTSDTYMAKMREYANYTPFSTNEVMSAGTRAIGVSGGDTKQAEQLMKVAGDMAA